MLSLPRAAPRLPLADLCSCSPNVCAPNSNKCLGPPRSVARHAAAPGGASGKEPAKQRPRGAAAGKAQSGPRTAEDEREYAKNKLQVSSPGKAAGPKTLKSKHAAVATRDKVSPVSADLPSANRRPTNTPSRPATPAEPPRRSMAPAIRQGGSMWPERQKTYLRPLEPAQYILSEESRAFLERRRIGEGVARQAKLFSTTYKEQDAIVFPYFKGGNMVNTKTRVVAKKMFTQHKGAEKVVYGYDDVIKSWDEAAAKARPGAKVPKELIIVEGEMDKLSCNEAGIWNVVSVPNGATVRSNSTGEIDKERDTNFSYLYTCPEIFDKVDKYVLFTDNDVPGRVLAEELARRLGREKCFQVEWPKPRRTAPQVEVLGHKDVAAPFVASDPLLVPAESVPLADSSDEDVSPAVTAGRDGTSTASSMGADDGWGAMASPADAAPKSSSGDLASTSARSGPISLPSASGRETAGGGPGGTAAYESASGTAADTAGELRVGGDSAATETSRTSSDDAAAAEPASSAEAAAAAAAAPDNGVRKDANEVLMKDGPEALARLVKAAQPLPVNGLFTFSDFSSSILDYYNGRGVEQMGAETGWKSLDPYYKVVPGELTIVTGIPNSGKSDWIDALTINIAKARGWSFAVCSMEKTPELLARQLLEKLIGKPFFDDTRSGTTRFSREDMQHGFQWLNEHYDVIAKPEGSPTIEYILDRAKYSVFRHGIRGLVIDPYNELDQTRREYENETEAVSRMLGKIKRFAQTYGVHVWFVAHPRQMQQWKGEPPSLYDISGSAHFINKADVAIVVHRKRAQVLADGSARQSDSSAPDNTLIFVRKVRNKAAGTQGVVELVYARATGTYRDKDLATDDTVDIDVGTADESSDETSELSPSINSLGLNSSSGGSPGSDDTSPAAVYGADGAVSLGDTTTVGRMNNNGASTIFGVRGDYDNRSTSSSRYSSETGASFANASNVGSSSSSNGAGSRHNAQAAGRGGDGMQAAAASTSSQEPQDATKKRTERGSSTSNEKFPWGHGQKSSGQAAVLQSGSALPDDEPPQLAGETDGDYEARRDATILADRKEAKTSRRRPPGKVAVADGVPLAVVLSGAEYEDRSARPKVVREQADWLNEEQSRS